MSAAHTARLYQFPPRSQSRPPARVQPMGLDLSRAVPADAAMVEANRVRTRDLIAARAEGQRAELVSALLLTLENNPLAPCLAYPCRDVGGHPFVSVAVAGLAFRVQPDDCRLAAATLIAEQAFTGCVQAAHDLREAANAAEQRCKGTATAPILTLASPSRTGMTTTVILAVLIAATVLVARLFGR